MPFEQAQQYLARVLPWPQDGQGYLNIHWTYQRAGYDKPAWSGKACRNMQEAIRALDFALSSSDTKDVYACLSSQREADERSTKSGFKWLAAKRSQANVVALKSLFLDIDVKGGDNGYPTMDEAIAALGGFIKTMDLPKPSMIVASGGGLHVYWTMVSALTIHEWQPLATALAEATKKHGLKCDTQCTVDAARILRVPDTFNRKSDPPRPVRIAGTPNDFDYAVERLERVLAPYKPAPVLPALMPRAPLQGVSDLSADIDRGKAIAPSLDAVAEECPFIKDAVTTGGKDNPNPLWNITQLIATFTEGGRADAHRMSDQHPKYTREETDEHYDRKEKEKLDKGLGWPQCQSISAQGSKFCQSCKHFPARKSPLNFASRVLPNNGQPSAILAAPGSDADLPAGYKRNSDGVVLQVATKEDGTEDLISVSTYPMENAWIQDGEPEILHFDIKIKNRARSIKLPLDVVNNMGMKQCLQAQGFMVPVGPKAATRVTEFIVSWIKKLQETKDSVHSSPFGWQSGPKGIQGFIYGGELWSPTGNSPAASPDPVLLKQYSPNGDLQHWVNAAKFITCQKRQDLAAILAASFGAPLVRFTGQQGVLMSAYSTESGIGKSTALKVAQAVWGDPVSATQSLTDTSNSVMGKVGKLRSIPLMWDELKTEEDTKKFVNITFQVTQGKEKSRMTRDIKQREPGTWQTLLVSCSNDSLLSYVMNHLTTTTAGLYRIFEYAVEPPAAGTPGQIDQTDASLIVAKLNDHFGTAGMEYAKFLGANHARIGNEVLDFAKKLNTQYDVHADERFWTALITVVCMGARYANELKLTEFDEVALKAFMLGVLADLRQERKSTPVDLGSSINIVNQLSDFYRAMRSRHTLFTNRIHVSKGKPATGSIQVKNDITKLADIWVHVGVDDKLMRVSSEGLGRWLTDKGVSRHLFIKKLMTELGATRVNGRLGGGCGFQITGGTEHLYQIDLAGTPLMNFIDET